MHKRTKGNEVTLKMDPIKKEATFTVSEEGAIGGSITYHMSFVLSITVFRYYWCILLQPT
jgi:hypothetical protein